MNLQQYEWLKALKHATRRMVRDYNSMLVWSMRPQVLLTCLILRISTEIPKGTEEEASDQSSVCLSCFDSFLRVLGV